MYLNTRIVLLFSAHIVGQTVVPLSKNGRLYSAAVGGACISDCDVIISDVTS